MQANQRQLLESALAFSQSIVNSVREPLIVLDDRLRVRVASRSFYETFKATREETEGLLLYELGNRQWDVPGLRELLAKIGPGKSSMETYEVEHVFPVIGRRVMLLDARRISDGVQTTSVLLAMYDVSDLRAAKREKEELVRRQDLQMREMRHRIANSLQIIASILLMKARSVQSRETRLHLQEAHSRVLSLATLQNQLEVSSNGEQVEMRRYLVALCGSLETSITRPPITLQVHADPDWVMSSKAVSLGLMTTELVINAVKHAFPCTAEGNIEVQYEVDAHGWHLSVADDGVGFLDTGGGATAPGLGMTIVEALASRLDGGVEITNTRPGTIVSVTAPKPRC